MSNSTSGKTIMSKPAKVWLVTGTSSGLGKRLVRSILARNDKVIATARVVEEIEHFRELADDSLLRTLQLDIADSSENVRARIIEAVNIWGHIDIFVSNAGTGYKMLLEEGGTDGLRKQFEVNTFGTMEAIYSVLPHMRERRSGVLVIIGSRSAFRNQVYGVGAYAASKAAIHSLAETLAAEVRPFNIKVLIVQPGSFRTEGVLRRPFHPGTITDYDEARAGAVKYIESVVGNEKGDPVKGMEVLVDVVRGEGVFEGRELPFWLTLGSDAEHDVRERSENIIKSLDMHADISGRSDFAANN